MIIWSNCLTKNTVAPTGIVLWTVSGVLDVLPSILEFFSDLIFQSEKFTIPFHLIEFTYIPFQFCCEELFSAN